MSDDELYWNALVPELTVSDLERSLEFYRSAGFSVRFRRQAPNFAYIERGEAQLMLEQQHDDGWNIPPLDRPLGRGINFQIEVEDATAVIRSMQALGVGLFEPCVDTWYATSTTTESGQREFLVQDPDGYLLRFAQYLGKRERQP